MAIVRRSNNPADWRDVGPAQGLCEGQRTGGQIARPSAHTSAAQRMSDEARARKADWQRAHRAGGQE